MNLYMNISIHHSNNWWSLWIIITTTVVIKKLVCLLLYYYTYHYLIALLFPSVSEGVSSNTQSVILFLSSLFRFYMFLINNQSPVSRDFTMILYLNKSPAWCWWSELSHMNPTETDAFEPELLFDKLSSDCLCHVSVLITMGTVIISVCVSS